MTDNRTFQTQVVNFPDRIILLGAALLIVAGTGAAIYLEMRSQFSVETFEQLIRSWGAWGVAASILFMIIHSFVPFPAELLALANGMIYEPVSLVAGAELRALSRVLTKEPGVQDAGTHRRSDDSNEGIAWAVYDPKKTYAGRLRAVVQEHGYKLR